MLSYQFISRSERSRREERGWSRSEIPQRRGIVSLPLVIVAVLSFLPDGGFCQSGDAASAAAVQAAKQEVVRREGVMREAEALLREGDLLHSKGELAEAVDQYRRAVLSLKKTAMEKALRGVALSKYEQAATEYGEQLVKGGRFDEAQRVTDELLDPEVGSEHRAAKQLEGQLDDPEYFNRSSSPEHILRVAKVEGLLSKGYGLIQLGDFDGASMAFAEVLAYDKYNSGARRGLEMVDQLVTKYSEASADHTRAKMLREVASEWETLVQSTDREASNEFNSFASGGGDRASSLSKKLKTIVVPTVSFNGARIDDVLEFLTARSKDLDTSEPDPSKKGVNFILNLEGSGSNTTRPVSLELRSVPLERVLQYATEQAGLKYKIDSFAVSVVPLTADAGSLVTEKFRVPPDFLSGSSMGGGADNSDPFAAPAQSNQSELTRKLTAREFLENNGVEFGPGASVAYNSNAGMLVVRNTPTNLELVDALVAGFRSDVPRQVLITTRVIDTTETRLEELGVSWLLAGFSIGSGIVGGGGTTGNVRPAGTTAGTTTSDFPVGVTPGFEGSGGLRTGSVAQPGDSIDSALGLSAVGNVVGLVGSAAQLAPAIFGITGISGSPNFEVVLRGLSQQDGVDLLTAPSTVVRSGQRAEIKTVREFIYPTEYDPPDIPNNIGSSSGVTGGAFPVTPANPTAFETREVGTTLEVEPIIGPDDLTVELNLSPEVSDFIGFINYGSPITTQLAPSGFFPGNVFQNIVTGALTFLAAPSVAPAGTTLLQGALQAQSGSTAILTQNRIVMPIFKAVRATTSVSIYDGQTVVLGGLMENRRRDVKDKIPIMGDLPVIGGLFRSSSVKNEKRAIVIFVSVRILDPSGGPLNEI